MAEDSLEGRTAAMARRRHSAAHCIGMPIGCAGFRSKQGFFAVSHWSGTSCSLVGPLDVFDLLVVGCPDQLWAAVADEPPSDALGVAAPARIAKDPLAGMPQDQIEERARHRPIRGALL